jgi:hypothetical protein
MTRGELIREVEARLDERLVVEDPPPYGSGIKVTTDSNENVIVLQREGPHFAINVRALGSPSSTGWNEFDAAVHVLRDPLIEARTAAYIREEPPHIMFDELLEISKLWSHGEQLLVLAALDLWNGQGHQQYKSFGLRRFVDTLSTDHVQRVIDGMRILARMDL